MVVRNVASGFFHKTLFDHQVIFNYYLFLKNNIIKEKITPEFLNVFNVYYFYKFTYRCCRQDKLSNHITLKIFRNILTFSFLHNLKLQRKQNIKNTGQI